jgi:hypothetical protein
MMPGCAPGLAPQSAHPDDIEEAKAVSTTVFLRTEPETENRMAARIIKAVEEKPSASVRVKVVAPHRVLHEGKPYVGGDVLEVPDDEEHNIWRRSGWVELVPVKPGPRFNERRELMAYLSGQVSVGTTATALFTTGPARNNDSVLVSSTTAAFIGGAGVTTTTGLAIPASTPVLVPTTGAENDQLFAVVGTGTATVSYLTIT